MGHENGMTQIGLELNTNFWSCEDAAICAMPKNHLQTRQANKVRFYLVKDVKGYVIGSLGADRFSASHIP